MLQSTVVNPYLLLLIILVIGGVATVPMVIYNTYNQLWMAWVLPYICGLQPYMLAQTSGRRKRIIQLLGDWNRCNQPFNLPANILCKRPKPFRLKASSYFELTF